MRLFADEIWLIVALTGAVISAGVCGFAIARNAWIYACVSGGLAFFCYAIALGLVAAFLTAAEDK